MTARHVERGPLRVERAPYLVFYNGERLLVSITQARALYELALWTRLSNERLNAILAGPNCNSDAVRRTQLSRLRAVLKPHGVHIRSISKFGYELIIDAAP